MLLKIIEPDSPQLGHILDFIRDESKIWTKYGLRSLSKDDVLYNARNTEHDPPYWRGQIWECVHFFIYDCKLRFYTISIMNNWQININFLTVRALEYYSKEIGPHSEKANQIFHELRGNIVNNVFEQYKKTGFIWENYNQDTGKFLKNCHRAGSARTLIFPKRKCH